MHRNIVKRENYVVLSYKADKLICFGDRCPFTWGAEGSASLGSPQERGQLCGKLGHQIPRGPLKLHVSIFGGIHDGMVDAVRLEDCSVGNSVNSGTGHVTPAYMTSFSFRSLGVFLDIFLDILCPYGLFLCLQVDKRERNILYSSCI